jgi:hypothetical protein
MYGSVPSPSNLRTQIRSMLVSTTTAKRFVHRAEFLPTNFIYLAEINRNVNGGSRGCPCISLKSLGG